MGARYQGNDDINAASSFVVSGRDVNGNAIVETVTVPEAAPDLFATLTTVVAGAIQIAQPSGTAAGRVTFLVSNAIDDEINYGEDLHFTVTVLDANGAVITEVVEVNRWNSENINATVQDFASVTTITSDGGFIGNLSIGLNNPVFTENAFISVESVVPIDENGNAYDNPYYDIDYGRFEFSADVKIVVEGG